MLNVKKLKKIRRYGKLRFVDQPLYNEEVLFRIYENATEGKRLRIDKEMDRYLTAIESGKLQPGDSLLKLAFPHEVEVS